LPEPTSSASKALFFRVPQRWVDLWGIDESERVVLVSALGGAAPAVAGVLMQGVSELPRAEGDCSASGD
jgi:hypothetical protein